MAGNGPLRFKKKAYRGENSAGNTPKWHRPVQQYDPKGFYREVTAQCGYKLGLRVALSGDIVWSTAVSPRGGVQCSKCEKKAREDND